MEEPLEFSNSENLIELIKNEGFLKYRDKPTMSPRIMTKWELDKLVYERILKVRRVREGGLLNHSTGITFFKFFPTILFKMKLTIELK